MADRGLSTRQETIEKKAEAAAKELEKLGENSKAKKAQLDELMSKVKDGDTLEPEELADLNDQIEQARDALEKAKAAAERTQKAVETLEKMNARAKNGQSKPDQATAEDESGSDAAKDNNGEDESNWAKRREAETKRDEAREHLKEAKTKQGELEEQIEGTKHQLEAAKAQKAKADTDANAAVDKLENDPANEAKQAAAKKMADHDAALARAKDLRAKAGKIESAETRRKAAEAKLDGAVGAHVEIGGEPGTIESIGADGVVVKTAAGEKTVQPDALDGAGLPAGFKENAQKLATAKQELAALTEGESGGNAGAIAHDMQQRATDIERGERIGNNPQKQAQRGQDKKLAADWNSQVDEAKGPANQAGDAVERAQKQLDDETAQLAKNKEQQTELETEGNAQEAEARKLRRTIQDHRSTEGWMEQTPEMLANLGGWLIGVLGLQESLDAAKAKLLGLVGAKPEPKKKPEVAAAATPGAPAGPTIGPAPEKPEKKDGGGDAGGGGEDKSGEAAKLRAEALEIGAAQATYEELVAMRPPADVSLLGDSREKAAQAAVRYHDAHDQAYKCYLAEVAVGNLAHDSAQLAEQGKPLQKQAQQMQAPIEKSKSDEAQRSQSLAGAQPGDVKGADSRMGGIVAELITKISSNADHLSQKPDAGGASGGQMAGGQDKAKQQADARSKEGQSNSQQQQQFLDQALQLRAKQDASVAKNIQSLEGKQQEELSIQGQIKGRKAAALAEEAAARAECEAESAKFNEGYARASTWAKQYEAKRASGAKPEGGGGGKE